MTDVNVDGLETDIKVLQAEYDCLCYAEAVLLDEKNKLLRRSHRWWLTPSRRADVQREIARTMGAINVVAEYRRTSLNELNALRTLYARLRAQESMRTEEVA